MQPIAFISHSVGVHEIPIVNRLAAEFTGAGIQPYVALYHREAGGNLTTKVKTAIDSSDALIVLWTAPGADSAWVNQEVGYALGRRLPVYALVEDGIEVEGMLHGVEYVGFDRKDPGPALSQVVQYLAQLRTKKELAEAKLELAEAHEHEVQMELLAGVVVLGLILVIVILAARK